VTGTAPLNLRWQIGNRVFVNERLVSGQPVRPEASLTHMEVSAQRPTGHKSADGLRDLGGCGDFHDTLVEG
jgi:hypothetical protein